MVHTHPASVHYPIAYLILGNSLRFINAVKPQLLLTYLPDIDSKKAIYYLQAVGLLPAVPAVLTGISELLSFGKKQGYYEERTGTLRKKTRVILSHTGFSIAAILGMWMVGGYEDGVKQDELWVMVVNILCTGSLLYGAKLGGLLAFQYGMGFASNTDVLKRS